MRTLNEGDHFGEIALIKNVRRTLATRAGQQPAKLLCLTRSTFNRVLGSIQQFLKEDYTKLSERGGPKDDGASQNVDGSFLSDHENSQNNSFLSQSKLYGIQEQDEYEDPLYSDR